MIESFCFMNNIDFEYIYQKIQPYYNFYYAEILYKFLGLYVKNIIQNYQNLKQYLQTKQNHLKKQKRQRLYYDNFYLFIYFVQPETHKKTEKDQFHLLNLQVSC